MTPFDLGPTLEQRFGPYIHLGRDEIQIWERFLLGEGASYAPFKYDVRVGTGIEMPEDSTDLAKQIAFINTTKRIDVVGTTRTGPLIIEIKVRAGLSVIGQLLGYATLYRSTFKYRGILNLMVVTDRLQPDTKEPYNQAGISWREV